MKKKPIYKKIAVAVVLGVVLLGTACGKKEQVELTVWGSPDSQDMLRQMTDEFVELHKKEANITINIQSENEDTVADNAINNPTQMADVFSFAGDQMTRLQNAGVLLPLEAGKKELVEANGGADSAAIQIASVGDVLYAYPLTASNGYFMYYNAEYFTEKEVETFDAMLEKADRSGKYISMDWTSGWYLYSFFGGAGMHIGTDESGKQNLCDFNQTTGKYKGVDVANAMVEIAGHASFRNTNDDGFKAGLESGEVVAGVNGPWNVEFVKSIWGDNYRAVKLPTYTLNGEQVQMGSFAGYKLIGVKAESAYPEWADKLAAFIANEENQLKRFEVTGETPSIIHAAQMPQVQASPAVTALMNQAPFSERQAIAAPYWNAATVYGTVVASGNPDGADLQMVLDDFVEAAQKPEE